MAAHLDKVCGRAQVWEKEVLPKIKDLITVVLRSAQAEITNRKGSFELYGIDIMLDGLYTYIYIYIYIYMICMHVYVCTYMYVCMCMYVCMYI